MRAPAALALPGAILVAVAIFVPVVPRSVTFYPTLSAASSEARTLFDLWVESGHRQASALFVLAVLSAWLAVTGRARLSWIPALLLVATAVWTWWVLQAGFASMVRDLPGGMDAHPFDHWVRPWPWLLLGAAVVLLGAASWRSYRDARLAHEAAMSKVFE